MPDHQHLREGQGRGPAPRKVRFALLVWDAMCYLARDEGVPGPREILRTLKSSGTNVGLSASTAAGIAAKLGQALRDAYSELESGQEFEAVSQAARHISAKRDSRLYVDSLLDGEWKSERMSKRRTQLFRENHFVNVGVDETRDEYVLTTDPQSEPLVGRIGKLRKSESGMLWLAMRNPRTPIRYLHISRLYDLRWELGGDKKANRAVEWHKWRFIQFLGEALGEKVLPEPGKNEAYVVSETDWSFMWIREGEVKDSTLLSEFPRTRRPSH